MNRLVHGATVLLALVVLPCGVSAAPKPDAGPAKTSASEDGFDILNKAPENNQAFAFDFGVPSSPGLTLLGVDKDKITQSNSLKPFVLSLPGLVSSQGGDKAVALDISLGSTLIPLSKQTFASYRDNPGRAWLTRTRVNVALYQGVDDSDASKQKPSRLAFGLSTSLLNSSDPLLASLPGGHGSAWIKCLSSASADIRSALPLPTGDPALDKKAQDDFAKTKQAQDVPTCMKVADLAARLAPDFDLGGGFVMDGDPGKLSGFGNSSGVFWSSFRTAIGVKGPQTDDYAGYAAWQEKTDQWFMIGGALRAGVNESIATGDKTTPKVRADTFTGWIGLESYFKTTHFSLQTGRQRTNPKADAKAAFGGTRTVYYAGLDQEVLADLGLWISISWGKAEGAGALKSDSTARITLTFSSPAARKIFGGL